MQATTPSGATISVRPVTLESPDRGVDLQIRVSAPMHGTDLPVVVFSHGFGKSMNDYAPLVDGWTAAGIVVVQPTHLDSRTLALSVNDPRTPHIWRHRIHDLDAIIDNLDTVLDAVPGLLPRANRGRIIAAGHSWGATTASALLGARIAGENGMPGEDFSNARVCAGVLLALAGHGQDDLTPFAAEHFSFMSPDFASMAPPALLVAGDADQSMLSTRGPDWWSDGYRQSPSPKSLLTLFGAQHSLGGVAGYDSTETTDEDPARVAVIISVTGAFIKDCTVGDGSTGLNAQTVDNTVGRFENK